MISGKNDLYFSRKNIKNGGMCSKMDIFRFFFEAFSIKIEFNCENKGFEILQKIDKSQSI
jgi:hypothetical protein